MSIPKDDLVQVGAIGLLKAIEAYEITSKGSFKTYVSIYIRGKILQYLRDKGTLVKLPREIPENIAKINQCVEQLANSGNTNPSYEEIASYANLPLKVVESALNADSLANIISLDQKIYSSEGIETLADRLQDSDNSYEETFENKKLIEYALNKLEDTEKIIIFKYYIEGMTKKNISEQLNISQMQVGRIIKRVLNKMYIILKDELFENEKLEVR